MNNKETSSGGQRLYRQVVGRIIELIESGEYPVGSRLPAERELAERFSVSRPTIREAVIALEAKERVEVKTGSGVYVLEQKSSSDFLGRAMSPFELVEARVLIEGEAAALAATTISDEQLARLKDALCALALENIQDNLGSTVADRQFHSIISEATGNRAFAAIIQHLWEVQEELTHIKMAHQAVCMSNAKIRMDEHTAIYDALEKRDPAAARAAMRAHFSRMLKALHDTTEEEAVQAVRRKVLEMRDRFSLNRFMDQS